MKKAEQPFLRWKTTVLTKLYLFIYFVSAIGAKIFFILFSFFFLIGNFRKAGGDDTCRDSDHTYAKKCDYSRKHSSCGGNGVNIAVADRCQRWNRPPHRFNRIWKCFGLCRIFNVIHQHGRNNHQQSDHKRWWNQLWRLIFEHLTNRFYYILKSQNWQAAQKF